MVSIQLPRTRGNNRLWLKLLLKGANDCMTIPKEKKKERQRKMETNVEQNEGRAGDEQVAPGGATGGRSSMAGSRLMAPVFYGSLDPSILHLLHVRCFAKFNSRESRRKNQEVPNCQHPTHSDPAAPRGKC